jgi:glucokinase
MSYVIGLDIGGSNVKSVCVLPDGEVLAQKSIETLREQPGWTQRVREHVAALEAAQGSGAMTVGVAAPGIAAPDGRSIWWMQGRLAELQGLDWTSFLGRQSPVTVMNDAQAALLGEVWAGAAEGYANVIMLTLGTGVGGAAMVDGRLLRGHLGRAGHLGHISLDPNGPLDIVNTPGSFEDAVGDCGIERRSGGRFKSISEMMARFDYDPEAERLWEQWVAALAAGVVSLINVLDPEIVILGGGLANRPSVHDSFRTALDRIEWRPHGRRVRIERASSSEFAGAMGAAWNAIQDAKTHT